MTERSTPARIARGVLHEPLLHFVLIGGLLFALHARLQGSRAQAPEPTPVEPSRVITVREAELQNLRESFRKSSKRDATPQQLGDLIEDWIGDEILYREGTALGLERDDAIVRQRVIEKMRTLARPAEPTVPERAELERWFASYPHRFIQAPRVTFEQIYFDAKRRAAQGQDANAAPLAALALLTREGSDPASVSGDNFVLSRRWEETPEPQIVNVFGEAFSQALMAAPVGTWIGPLGSEYGLHLVRVTRRDAQRMPSFAEAEAYVRADYMMVEARALSEVKRTFLPRYKIRLEGAELKLLAKTAALEALLREAAR